jgi:hypothetical protein
MRKIIIVLIILSTFLSERLFSQTNYEDVVYLKNGSIIKGVIIEQIPNKSLKIETRDGNVFVYKIDEVEKITKEKNFKNENNDMATKTYQKSGYTNITDLTVGLGLDNYSSNTSFGLQTINGYTSNSITFIGLGVGFDYVTNNLNKIKITFVPLFANNRINISKGFVAPFVSFSGGYIFGTDKYNQGGLLINPDLGIRFLTSNQSSINISFGYKYFENTYTSSFYKNYSQKARPGFISIKLGASF